MNQGNMMRNRLLVLFWMSFYLQTSYALEVQGHRGARWVRPENTIPAFEYALQVGVDTLEMDTLVTKDDQIVVYHDPVLNPSICLDGKGKKIKSKIPIRSLTLKELKAYDCGSLVNPRFPNQVAQPKTAIPTLEEVLEWVKKSKYSAAKSVLFNIEAKSDEDHPEFSPSPEEFVKLIIEEIKKQDLLDRVTIQSFDLRCLKIARQLEPKLSLSILIQSRFLSTEKAVKLMKEYQVQVFSPNFEWLNAKDVVALHKIGARVIPWTANDKEEWQSLIAMGVDGIITDNPKELLDYIKDDKTAIQQPSQ